MTRRVLMTGVSSGIGLAQARLFLENGYQVYGVDQGENPLLEGDFHFLQREALKSYRLLHRTYRGRGIGLGKCLFCFRREEKVAHIPAGTVLNSV